MTRDDSTMVKGVPQATQPHAASSGELTFYLFMQPIWLNNACIVKNCEFVA